MKQIRVRVAGVLENNGEILMIAHQKNGRKYWLLPGGGVDYGETFQEALKREFKEEVNLNIGVKSLLFISESIAPDSSRHIVNIFFEVEHENGEIKLGEEGILSDVAYIPIDRIDEYTVYPNIKKELKEYFTSHERCIQYLGNRWE